MTIENQFGIGAEQLGRASARAFHTAVTLGVAGSAMVALAGLLAYIPGLRILGSIRPGYVPMAPSTAVCFLILGVVLLRHARKPWQGFGMVVAMSLVLAVAVFGLLGSVGDFFGMDLNFEDRLVPEFGTLGQIPIGRMSIAAAGAFSLAGLGMFLLLLRSRKSGPARCIENWSSSLGVLVALSAATVLLGYLYGTPLLYGGTVVPMAATTAVAFLLLGSALAAACGPGRFPIGWMTGTTTYARLLRVFLPLAAGGVLLQSAVSRFVPVLFAANEALRLSVLAVGVTAITAAAVARVARVVGNRRDEADSELRKALFSLSESEERFRGLFENMTEGYASCRMIFENGEPRDFVYLAVNPAFETLTGLRNAAGRKVSEVIPGIRESDPQLFAVYARVSLTGKPEKVEMYLKALGMWFSISVCGAGQGCFIAMFDIITERKQAEARVQESTRLIRTVFDHSPYFIYVKDREGRFLLASRSLADFFGQPHEQLIGKTSHDFLPRATADQHRANDRAVIEQQALLRAEETAETKSGLRTFYSTKFPLSDDTGRTYAVCGISVEVTDRKQAEESLRESLAHHRALVEGVPGIVYSYSSRHGGTYYSSRVEIILGYSPEQLHAQPMLWHDSLHPEDLSRVQQSIGDALNGGSFHIEYRIRDSQGAWHWFDDRSTECRKNGDEVIIDGFVMDVTDHKRAEEEKARLEAQFLQAQKMESVGRLAGGIAHDFNNMLGVILGHAEVAQEQVAPSDPLNASLEEIRKAANRSADLTRQLLAFARKQTVSPLALDLNRTVEGMLTMLQSLIGEDIILGWQPGADVWPIMMDPSQVDQILANLCVNARDAISDVGTVRLETGNSTFGQAWCADHPGFLPGEYVRLAVSDDGCGMDKETLGHLFEPFFTTKGMGKGTGLGLATVYGIVQQNSGFINVLSEPGRGATFAIHLPRHMGAAEPVRGGNAAGPALRGRETILLVEDEPANLTLIRTMLERQGYTVLGAGTPTEALRLARENDGNLRLLITDVIMPEMNGRDLARTLTGIHPRLKSLFMSGYTSDVIAHHGVLNDGVCFIQKPFSRKDLAAKVREALGGEQGHGN